MKYSINNKTAPKMPTLGKGTECIRLLLSQTSKDMHESLVPMLFPSLGAHISGTEFQYPDISWNEPCGMMANLVADFGGNNGQLSNLVESICRKFSKHNDEGLKKLVEWQRNPFGSHEPHRERERKLFEGIMKVQKISLPKEQLEAQVKEVVDGCYKSFLDNDFNLRLIQIIPQIE